MKRALGQGGHRMAKLKTGPDDALIVAWSSKIETPGVASATQGPKMEISLKFGFPEQSCGMCNFEQTGSRME